MIDFILRKLSNFFAFLILGLKWFLRNVRTGNSDSLACLVGKTAIVTGGNAGIGYATSLLLASRGCKVIIACRSDATEAKEEIIRRTGNPNIETRKLDLCSLKSVRDFAEEIKKSYSKIDILINNAGTGIAPQEYSEDGLVSVMQINCFGHFLLTHLLLDPLKASGKARVVFIGSIMALIQELKVEKLNTHLGRGAKHLMELYSNAKFLSILMAQEFGKKLRKFNITANAADTGASNTNILNHFNAEGITFRTIVFYIAAILLARDPLNAAQSSFHLASSEKLENETGELYFRCKRFEKSVKLKDQSFCDSIWRKTEELVELKPEEKI